VTGSGRWSVLSAGGLAVLLAAAPAVTASAHPAAARVRLAGPAQWTSAVVGGLQTFRLQEPAYTLTLSQGTADLRVATAAGAGPLTLPITALIGRPSLPTPARFRASVSGAELTLATVGAGAGLLVTTIVTGAPGSFTVKFLAQAGPGPGAVFFGGGTPATTMAAVTGGLTPDPALPSSSRTPTVVVGNTGTTYSEPFAPPPLMVGLDTPAGWVALGLVGVPNASIVAFRPGSGLVVNYPLAQISAFADIGAGGRVSPPSSPVAPAAAGTWLGFPRFVVAFGATALGTLDAYSAALSGLGMVPVAYPPGTRPAWWSWPFTDTWGQQFLVDGLGSKRPFSTGWVLSMVAAWRSQFGLQHFTVVLDDGWEQRLGGDIPAAGFGGIQGMRRLINQLHAEGLKVVLWWPLWLTQLVPHGPRRFLDPSAPGFAAATQAEMRVLLGSGPGDLNADGIKYDWGYLVPQPSASHFADPQEGLGAAALFHYLKVLSTAVWAAHPGALIDGGAAAPQFDGLEGVLRLYDGLQTTQWSARAAIAASADPEVGIDGDGFLMDQSQALPHAIGSAVYGTPALYYATQWAGGQPIPAAQAHLLGLILSLGATRGQGEAVPLANGAWDYVVHQVVTARTLDGGLALVVYQTSPCGAVVGGTVVGTAAASMAVPLPPGATAVQVSDGPGAAVPSSIANGTAVFALAAGARYQLRVSGAPCAGAAASGGARP